MLSSVEDVYNQLKKDKKDDYIQISLSNDKELIKITLSPIKEIFADDDMVEISCKKKLFKIEYWSSTHWHPSTFEDLYKGLLKELI